MIIRNFIWIFGLAIIVAVFSYYDFIAQQRKTNMLTLLLSRASAKPMLLGSILAVTGIGLSAKSPWLTAAAIAMALGIGAAAFILYKKR